MCSRFDDFEIMQMNRSGIRRIEVRDNSGKRPIGEIYGNKIQANSEKVFIAEIGPTRNGDRQRGKRQMFSFRRERDDSEIGWIETAKFEQSSSRIKNLLSAFKKSERSECTVWDGQLVSEVVDFRMMLASSILLDIDR